jgi:uncharacterized protein YndB with AHSA1/START domain
MKDYATATRITQHTDDAGRIVVRFERFLEASAQRVWSALTVDDELAVWYATRVHMEAVSGGVVTFAFPGGEPFEGAVLSATPSRELTFTTLDDVLRWQLVAASEGTMLILDNVVGHPPHAPYTAAGFHITLDQLGTFLAYGAGAVQRTEMPPCDDLVDHYRDVLDEQ